MLFQFKYRTKLTFFVSVILGAVLLISIFIVANSTRDSALERGFSQIRFASDKLNKNIDLMTTQLTDGARVVALDFSHRREIALGDVPTKRSVILNLKDRIKADRVMLLSMDANIVVDTEHPNDEIVHFPYPELLAVAEDRDQAETIATLDSILYRLSVVPVRAPEPIAWIVVGLAINDPLAKRLQDLAPIPLNLTFVVQPETKIAGWNFHATTLTDKETAKDVYIGIEELAALKAPSVKKLGNSENIVFASPIDKADTGGRVFMLLQYSVADAFREANQLRDKLLLLLGMSLLLAMAGAYFMARGVTRPLNVLVEAVGRVGRGNYAVPIELKGNDEFGALSSTFNDMMQGIQEREAKIAFQARYDALTSLPNRSEFIRRLEKRLANWTDGQQVSVIVVEVERLAETNSMLGYEIGDGLIREIAHRLLGAIQEPNQLSRLESDKFAVMFSADRKHEVSRSVGDLQTLFAAPVELNGIQLAADLNYGIAMQEAPGGDAEQLVHQAEIAGFKARGGTTGFYIFDHAVDDVNPDQLLLIAELRQAIRDGQFTLHYQPKINLKTRKVFAVEALIRWMHPVRGRVPPDSFIPLAEQTGDVREISNWVLAQATKDGAELMRNGHDIQVAINLSALDLGNRELPGRVAALLQETGLPKDNLILEITESGLMSEPALARALLTELDDMGITLSVDDYGTGYSSLAYLKELPVSELKIDQAFVRHLASNPEDALIVRSTVDLGHNLGMKVTAEGVEDEESFEMLQDMGCDVGQGYYMARPIPLEDLQQFLLRSPWSVEKPAVAKAR